MALFEKQRGAGMSNHIHHVHIFASDLDKTIKFYEDYFDGKIVMRPKLQRQSAQPNNLKVTRGHKLKFAGRIIPQRGVLNMELAGARNVFMRNSGDSILNHWKSAE